MTSSHLTMVRQWLGIGGTIAAIVFAWAMLTASVRRLEEVKADKSDVIEMARDIRIIKLVLCGRTPTDSFCRGTP